MKLYLPHAFCMAGKNGELVEYKAGSESEFPKDVAEALKARFGAVEPEKAERAEKVEPAAKRVDPPPAVAS